jgi:hypothetical protein
MVSKVVLGSFFDKHGYVGNTKQLAEVLPGFEVTNLDTYLRNIFKTGEKANQKNWGHRSNHSTVSPNTLRRR